MAKGLVVSAKKYELQVLRKNKSMLSKLSSFEILLNDVIKDELPSPQDYEKRRNVIRLFNDIAKEIYGNDSECPVVKEFGSFLMDMFNVKSDLDLSINFTGKADRVLQVQTLRRFTKKLRVLQRSQHVSNIQLISSARVPVLKVTHRETGVECDFSVGNLDGILKSEILLMICSIDERFKKLSLLLKAWAKAHGINSAKDGTMNSLSLTLLAAFHLQTQQTPILPPFSAILKDGVDAYLEYGENNTESLAELFVSLLLKLESVEPLWALGLCASTFEGSWLDKMLGCVSIEDFMERSQNVSRALKPDNKGKIYSCIRHSIEKIRLFTIGKFDANELKDWLFGARPVVVSKGGKGGKKRKRTQVQSETPVVISKGENGGKKRKKTQVQSKTPRRKKPSSQTSGGLGPQRNHVEQHMNYVAPNLTAGQPFSFSMPPLQELGNLIEAFTYASNFLSQDPYSLVTSSTSVVPPYQPHIPLPLTPNPVEFGRPRRNHTSFPVGHLYGNGYHAPDDRGVSGHRFHAFDDSVSGHCSHAPDDRRFPGHSSFAPDNRGVSGHRSHAFVDRGVSSHYSHAPDRRFSGQGSRALNGRGFSDHHSHALDDRGVPSRHSHAPDDRRFSGHASRAPYSREFSGHCSHAPDGRGFSDHRSQTLDDRGVSGHQLYPDQGHPPSWPRHYN